MRFYKTSELPDYWGIKIYYINGKSEEIEGMHKVISETGTIEILSSDDVWSLIPIANIQRIEFDKRFSEAVAFREKEREKK